MAEARERTDSVGGRFLLYTKGLPVAFQPIQFEQEVKAKKRFEFGLNWAKFLKSLDDGRIQIAEDSVSRMLELPDLRGLRFMDVGCGSGLFSLAARRMGATVHSFDYDPASVACTKYLRDRYFPGDAEPGDPHWVIEQGSALDENYLNSLGKFEVVYSWGVLHHTGDMWKALANAAMPVADGGRLFISIYNDQGTPSRRWAKLKKFYNQSPGSLRILIATAVMVQQWWRAMLKDLLLLRPFATWRAYRKQILDFYRARGFSLIKLKTCRGNLGCNEFVFERNRPN